ncbi:antirepressor [Bacillus thuringiensis]|uniref:antA/AntB antirepressor family protein n=1 Tax=Bacillus thuringiensis TaxID=1428 RepID=UPI0018CCE4C3|nr:antA/AntB antirepressor family protein [Bacillus thuringiensis]MBG9514266.1 antirepressor [Bacillus thuringiensis]
MSKLIVENKPPLKLFENGIVRIMATDTGEKVVNRRNLHKGLHVRKDSSSWVKDRIEK